MSFAHERICNAHPRDLGIMAPDGRLEICGRLKDIVIRGGENISPAEIEAAVDGHPQVLQCAVFGVPDERMGEELVAWLVLRNKDETLSAEDLRQWLSSKVRTRNSLNIDREAIRTESKERVIKVRHFQLTPFKIPRHVFVVESLYRTASGKLLKYKMSEETVRKYLK